MGREAFQSGLSSSSVINERHIKGEPNTGFEQEDGKGRFDCGNCEYFHALLGGMGGCDQTEMMIYSRQPRLPESRRVLVHEDDCCEYVERVGRRGQEPEAQSDDFPIKLAG